MLCSRRPSAAIHTWLSPIVKPTKPCVWMCCESARQSGAHLKKRSRGNGGTLPMAGKGVGICSSAVPDLRSDNKLQNGFKWAVLAVVLVSPEDRRCERRIDQRLSMKKLCAILRCLHPSSIHLGLVSGRKAAARCLDKPRPLCFHVGHVLPVTAVIALLPTGGFPSPASPPPSSVIRAPAKVEAELQDRGNHSAAS